MERWITKRPGEYGNYQKALTKLACVASRKVAKKMGLKVCFFLLHEAHTFSFYSIFQSPLLFLMYLTAFIVNGQRQDNCAILQNNQTCSPKFGWPIDTACCQSRQKSTTSGLRHSCSKPSILIGDGDVDRSGTHWKIIFISSVLRLPFIRCLAC